MNISWHNWCWLNIDTNEWNFTLVQHELHSRLMKCQWAILVWHAPKHATSSSQCPSPIHNPIWLPRGQCLMRPTGVSSMCMYQQSLLLVELSQRLIAHVISHSLAFSNSFQLEWSHYSVQLCLLTNILPLASSLHIHIKLMIRLDS